MRSPTRSSASFTRLAPKSPAPVPRSASQARSRAKRGLAWKRTDGATLTYRDGIVHHFTAAIATVTTAAKNRERLLRDFLEYRRSAIDEQAALTHDRFIIAQALDNLDHLSIRQPGLDVTSFDRLVVTRDPDVGGFAVVDDCVARNSRRAVSFAGENGHAREHFGAQQMLRIVDRSPHQ